MFLLLNDFFDFQKLRVIPILSEIVEQAQKKVLERVGGHKLCIESGARFDKVRNAHYCTVSAIDIRSRLVLHAVTLES